MNNDDMTEEQVNDWADGLAKRAMTIAQDMTQGMMEAGLKYEKELNAEPALFRAVMLVFCSVHCASALNSGVFDPDQLTDVIQAVMRTYKEKEEAVH